MSTAALSLDTRSAQRRLQGLVDQAMMRLRLHEALKATVLSGTVVAWLLVPMLLADKLFALSALGFSIWIVWAGLAALCIPYILWRAFSNRIHEQFAAIVADERLGLHSRLATALTLDPDDDSGFSEAFFHEAADRLAKLDPTKAFPIRMPKLAYAILPAAAIAAAIFYFVPQRDLAGFVAKAQEKRLAEDLKQNSVKKLQATLDDLKKDQNATPPEDSAQFKVNQLIKKADQIAKELKEGKRDPNEAVIALAELKREIGEQRDKIDGDGKDLSERLKGLSEKDLNLEENDYTKEISEALKQGDAELAAREMRKLARKIKNEVMNDPNKTDEQKAEEMKKLQNEIEKLAGALEDEGEVGKDLMEAAKQSMSAAEYQQLQEEIKKQLNEQEGKNNQTMGEKLEEQLNEAAEELENQDEGGENELSEEEEDAQDQLDQLEEGVDSTMEGLTEQSGSCQGCKEGENGQKSGQGSGKKAARSSKSGKAARGGKRMAGQKSGAKEGQDGDNGPKGKQSSSGGNEGGDKNQGGKPNSGFSGPNEGGPGMGKRAYRDGDALFQSEMVRGKMQSGAITGLSHFRGQGAKGDAPTQYVQALTAAEQDATSSLEVDRIPADAREMVKDYFSKLKEDTSGSIKPAVAPTPAGNDPAPAPKAEGEALKE
ncbi:MAG: hypothetical protein KIS92_09030 [Planctomycetota bacterium]|nr:hypothetical protein [Planctomycetota bacterium]